MATTNTNDALAEELMCPIENDWLEDPISVPCCGRAFSRASLCRWIQNRNCCPLCNSGFPEHFNPSTEPRNVTINNLVEVARRRTTTTTTATNISDNTPDLPTISAPESETIPAPLPTIAPAPASFSGNVSVLHHPLGKDHPGQTKVLRVHLRCLDANVNAGERSILILAVDKSGSMSGDPLQQVRFALAWTWQLAARAPNLDLVTLGYDHRCKEIRDLDELMRDNGGTTFEVAFTEICNVLDRYRHGPNPPTNATVIFMTDGQDSNAKGAIAAFKKRLNVVWPAGLPLVIHTVGFSRNHDFELLNQIRLVGSEEGAYRYAEPGENNDSLNAKICSVVNPVINTTSAPLSVEILSQIKASSLSNGECNVWFATGEERVPDSLAELQAVVRVPRSNQDDPKREAFKLEQILQLPVHHTTDRELWNLWYSKLTDDIIKEISELNLRKSSLAAEDKELFGVLLRQRARAVLAAISASPVDGKMESCELSDQAQPGPIIARLEGAVGMISKLLAGEEIDKYRLTDLQFEGRFATKTRDLTHDTAPRARARMPVGQGLARAVTTRAMPTYCYRKQKRYQKGGPLHLEICSSSLDKLKSALQVDPSAAVLEQKDENGNTPLALAASIGRLGAVTMLFEHGANLGSVNKFGETPLDLACLYGYWKIVQYLIGRGFTGIRVCGDVILATCMAKGFVNTANALVEAAVAFPKEAMINNAKSQLESAWVMTNIEQDLPSKIHTAIEGGLASKIQSLLPHIKSIGSNSKTGVPLLFKNFLHVLEAPKSGHIETFRLLLKEGKMDIWESWSTTVFDVQAEQDTSEEIWPMFIAAERGELELARLCLEFSKNAPEDLEKRNSKGTTALWIAACNRKIELVDMLLSAGANVNAQNHKGDPALIPACQKGADMIVQMLLDGRADLDLFNVSRDNALLICCRTDQARCLEHLIARYEEVGTLQEALTWAAEIDGFNPILAATELDNCKCISVLHAHGANLEHRTAPDNAIIASATPVHLACFYGRLRALRLLHELGADIVHIKTGGPERKSPLHIAVEKGHASLVRYLLSEGADPQEEDGTGRTAIFYATTKGNEAIFEEFFYNPLVKPLRCMAMMASGSKRNCWGAVPNASSSNLNLNAAVTTGPALPACIKILRDHGSSPGCFELSKDVLNIDCGQGATPLSLSVQRGNLEIAQALGEMGANWDQADYRGLTPAFWRALALGEETTNPAVIHVRNVAKKGMQNKLLMDVAASKTSGAELVGSEGGDGPAIASLMAVGYSSKVRAAALNALKSKNAEQHSLLNFIDKLGKMMSKSAPEAQRLLFDAKIHIISAVATEATMTTTMTTTTTTPLEAHHILALYLYTAEELVLKVCDEQLVQWAERDAWNPFVHCLYQGMSRLPCYAGECYRHVGGAAAGFKWVELGTVISWDAFSNASSDWRHVTSSAKPLGIIYIIQSKTGRLLGSYSKYPQNNQVTFLPGTQFVVKDYYAYNIIVFGQANIRKSTYAAKKLDISNAEEGKQCIVIEIEEKE